MTTKFGWASAAQTNPVSKWTHTRMADNNSNQRHSTVVAESRSMAGSSVENRDRKELRPKRRPHGLSIFVPSLGLDALKASFNQVNNRRHEQDYTHHDS